VAYLLLDYTSSDRPPDLRGHYSLDEVIVNPDRYRDLVVWVMNSGRLSEYALERNLGANRAAAGHGRGNNNNSNNYKGNDNGRGSNRSQQRR